MDKSYYILLDIYYIFLDIYYILLATYYIFSRTYYIIYETNDISWVLFSNPLDPWMLTTYFWIFTTYS